MLFSRCYPDSCGTGFCVPEEILYSAAAVAALLVLLVLILSICLCRVCRKRKKKKLTEVMDECPEEANLHYAELQNLPDSGRGQCDGGTCPAPPVSLGSEYATIAELTESTSEGNHGDHQQIEDDRVENGNPYSLEPGN